MLSDRAIQLISDAKIESAIRQGKFSKLAGLGKPFEFDELAYDPNWWIRRKMEIEKIRQYNQPSAKERKQ